MQDPLSDRYRDLLQRSYDCVDRIVLNGHFRLASSGGGFRTWWRRLYGRMTTWTTPGEVEGKVRYLTRKKPRPSRGGRRGTAPGRWRFGREASGCARSSPRPASLRASARPRTTRSVRSLPPGGEFRVIDRPNPGQPQRRSGGQKLCFPCPSSGRKSVNTLAWARRNPYSGVIELTTSE